MTRSEVVAETRSWLGVPYRQKGRSRIGLDCIGLLVMVGRAFHVPHVDQQHYTDWPDPHRRILTELDGCLDVHPRDGSWEGTIGVFAEAKLPGHVGIFSVLHGVKHLIHARIGTRSVIEEPFDGDPRSRQIRLIRLYGFPGMTD